MNHQEMLLSSLISKEVDDLSGKLAFWNQDRPQEIGTLWEADNALTLETALASISVESPEFANSEDLQNLYCLGWEFIWGHKPPEIVTEKRTVLLQKSRLGLDLTPFEKLWLEIIMVDTDYF